MRSYFSTKGFMSVYNNLYIYEFLGNICDNITKISDVNKITTRTHARAILRARTHARARFLLLFSILKLLYNNII